MRAVLASSSTPVITTASNRPGFLPYLFHDFIKSIHLFLGIQVQSEMLHDVFHCFLALSQALCGDGEDARLLSSLLIAANHGQEKCLQRTDMPLNLHCSGSGNLLYLGGRRYIKTPCPSDNSRHLYRHLPEPDPSQSTGRPNKQNQSRPLSSHGKGG